MKTGIDLVYVPKIITMMEHRETIAKILHPSEMKPWNAYHLAGRIALKEAFFKCFETIPKWLDLEIIEQENGKPKLVIHSELKEQIKEIDYSISHDGEYVIAQVIIMNTS